MKSFAAPDRFQKTLRSAVCTNMGLVTLWCSARLDLHLIATAGMDLVGTLAVMMLIRTALFFKHRAGCHVPYALPWSVQGTQLSHSPLQADSFEMQCMCAISLSLSLWGNDHKEYEDAAVLLDNVQCVGCCSALFILSKINTAKKQQQQSLLNTTSKHSISNVIQSFPLSLSWRIHFLFHYTY